MSNSESSTPSKSLAWKILHFPLTRIIIAIFFTSGAAAAINFIHPLIIQLFSIDNEIAEDLISMALIVPAVHFAYILYVKLLEKRTVSELSFSAFSKELTGGIMIGAGLITAVISIMWALGYYQVSGLNVWTLMLPIFAISVVSGYVEEVIVRGIIFRIMEEGLGTWLSILISAVLFGLLHMSNPGATAMSSITIAATAGVLLAAAYVLTRRLWMAIGIHFAWNFSQGGIYSVAISGREGEGLLDAVTEGPVLMTGGDFGAEASIITLILGFGVGAIMLFRAYKRNNFIDPFWRRSG